MPPKFTHEWPSDEEIVAGCLEHGTVAKYAAALSVSRASLGSHMNRRGISAPKTTRKLKAASAKPVGDPDRLRISQQAAEIKELRHEAREYEKQLSSQEVLFARIADVCRLPVEAPHLVVPKQNPDLPKRTVILPIFDIQYGQHVVPSDTPAGVGQYSTAIFDDHLARYLEAVTYSLDDYATAHTIDELVFVLGGDLVEGDEIYPGMAWQLEIDPPRQVYEIKTKLGAAIKQVTRHAKEAHGVPAVGLYCVPGNHGKVGGKKSGARPTTYSWD